MQKFLDELKRTDGFLVVPHDGSRVRVRVHAPNGQMTFFPTKVGNGTALSNARAWARRHGLPEADLPGELAGRDPGLPGVRAQGGRDSLPQRGPLPGGRAGRVPGQGRGLT